MKTKRHIDRSGYKSRLRGFSRHGVAAVWVTVWLLLLLAIIGLGVDLGKISLGLHQLQNAVDSAALAGAQLVKVDHDAARAACHSVSQQNTVFGTPVELLDADIIPGYWLSQTRTFTPYDAATGGPTNAMRVIGRRTSAVTAGPISLLFGRLANKPTADIVCDAIAWSVGTTGAGMIALSDTGTGLSLGGNATAYVDGGDIQVNSSDPDAALYGNGNISTDADEINVVGALGGPIDWDQMAIDNGLSINSGPDVPPITDPLADLPEPSLAGMTRFDESIAVPGGETRTIDPGYYPNGMEVSSGGLLIMNPGIYAIGPGPQNNINPNNPPVSLRVAGGGTLEAVGVMLYLTHADDPADFGVLNLEGTSTVTLHPIDDESSIYNGMSIFQARDNIYDSTIRGTSENFDIEGTLYFPNNLVDVGGDGLALGNQLIANKISIAGNSSITINYDGRNFVVGYRSFLVK